MARQGTGWRAAAQDRHAGHDHIIHALSQFARARVVGPIGDADRVNDNDVGDEPGPQLWIVDPHGNLVLRYDVKAKGKHVLDDLRHLLKLSNIG